MHVSHQNLNSVDKTIATIKEVAKKYALDVADYAGMSIPDFFDLVKNIPYKFDTWNGELREIVKRPFYTLRQIGPGGDCDDKTTVLLSYAILNDIPTRLKTVGRSKKEKVHHIFPEFLINGKWVPMDATYPRNTIGRLMGDYQKVMIYGNSYNT